MATNEKKTKKPRGEDVTTQGDYQGSGEPAIQGDYQGSGEPTQGDYQGSGEPAK